MHSKMNIPKKSKQLIIWNKRRYVYRKVQTYDNLKLREYTLLFGQFGGPPNCSIFSIWFWFFFPYRISWSKPEFPRTKANQSSRKRPNASARTCAMHPPEAIPNM